MRCLSGVDSFIVIVAFTVIERWRPLEHHVTRGPFKQIIKRGCTTFAPTYRSLRLF